MGRRDRRCRRAKPEQKTELNRIIVPIDSRRVLANRSGADTTISAATHLSRSLCLTADEADAENEHAHGQQHCADIGEIDEPVRGRGIGRQHG
jgi:hypothetical protein